MLFSTSLAVLGFAALAQSHVKMSTPTPFSSHLDNFPLNSDGSNFPCKQPDGAYISTEGNTMELGSEQHLSFIGSAVHGGGSCQVSITYDLKPTKNSVWKVIHSIQGGCPMKNIDGNNGDDANAVIPDKYPFTIPKDLPTGQCVLSWTWFNRIGNREMYQNCAPVTITGSSTKRNDDHNATQLAERDQAAFDALPDMFVANIDQGEGASCTSEGVNIQFPNAGDSVENNNDGKNQGPSGVLTKDPETGALVCLAAGSASSPVVTAPAQTSAVSPKPTVPGGVFVTVPVAGGDGSADPQPTNAPAQPTTAPASPSSTTAPPQAPSETPTPASPAAPPAGTGTSGNGSVLSGPCTTEGQWNCIGGTSFQQCGSGTWSVVQQLAAGTTCASGQSSAISISAIGKAKRAIRFSHEHFRRHLRSS